jgi:hypothetical protein
MPTCGILPPNELVRIVIVCLGPHLKFWGNAGLVGRYIPIASVEDTVFKQNNRVRRVS